MRASLLGVSRLGLAALVQAEDVAVSGLVPGIFVSPHSRKNAYSPACFCSMVQEILSSLE